MTALVGISCDGCGRTLAYTTTTQPAAGWVRDLARKDGWHKRRGLYETVTGRTVGYSRDICPNCWKEGKR